MILYFYKKHKNFRFGHLEIKQNKFFTSNENMETKISSKVNPIEGV